MPMALNVQMVLSENKLIGEKIVTPRIVNQQTLDYDTFCDYLAQGSTVTAADVSAVMKQLEKNIPLILGLNAKIVASPDGLTFRPTVKGSITQSQLKAKLAQRKADYLAAGNTAAADKINIDRDLAASDLSVSDLTAYIVIDMPKKWDIRFQQSVEFKRIVKGIILDESAAGSDPDDPNGAGSDPDDTNGGGSGSGSDSGGGSGSGSDSGGGSGSDSGGGDDVFVDGDEDTGV